MNKCYRISWDGRDVGSSVGDSLLRLAVTVHCLCSALQKGSFVSHNMEQSLSCEAGSCLANYCTSWKLGKKNNIR
jgi:hypothetical protein